MATKYPLECKEIVIKTIVPAYGHNYYRNADGTLLQCQLQPGDTARVVHSKCTAVRGNRPYFTLVEFERDGQTQRAAVWPGDWNYTAEDAGF